MFCCTRQLQDISYKSPANPYAIRLNSLCLIARDFQPTKSEIF